VRPVLGHPEVIEGQALAPNRQTCVRIIEKLCDSTSSAAEIEDIVKSDLALSYRLLKAAGTGANRGPLQRLSSVRDAIVLLGQRRLRSWMTLMLLADSHEGSGEQLRTALTRARMAELMAGALEPGLADPAYTVGLLSALDQVLAAPRWKIVEGLSLTGEVEDALLGQPGLLGDVLADVVAWQLGGGNVDLRSHTSPEDAERFYQQALA